MSDMASASHVEHYRSIPTLPVQIWILAASATFAEGQEFVMSRLKQPVLGMIFLAIISATGCSLCCSPYTDDYVTFGSRTPRLDMKQGRVGSTLSDNQVYNGIQAQSSDYREVQGEYLDYPGESSEIVLQDDDGISLGSP